MNKGDGRAVEFDIAVAVEKSDSASGKAGIRVLEFLEGGGDINKITKNSTVSRVTFGVNVDYFTKDETKRQSQKVKELNEGGGKSFGL